MTAEDIDGVLDAGHRGAARAGPTPASSTAPRCCATTAEILREPCRRARSHRDRRDGQADHRGRRRGREVRLGVRVLRREVPEKSSPTRRSRPAGHAAGSATNRWAPCWRSCRGTTPTGRCSGSSPPPSWRATPASSSTRPTSPASPWPSSSMLRDAGLPDGVFRTLVVAEPDVPATVDRLIQDDRIAAVTLTGSNARRVTTSPPAPAAPPRRACSSSAAPTPSWSSTMPTSTSSCPRPSRGASSTPASPACAPSGSSSTSRSSRSSAAGSPLPSRSWSSATPPGCDHQDRTARAGRPCRRTSERQVDASVEAGAKVLTGGTRARPGTGLVRPDRAGQRHPRHAGHGRGDLRPGRGRHRVRHRRRGRRRSPTPRRTASAPASGPPTPNAPWLWARASTPVRSSSTRSPPPTPACRSVASSRAATAASSARRAPREFTNIRTVLVG